ncbi:helix-turn-helix domain-containing protein [Sutcliffiella halmapala]|uniref:helix-turn-helix domain-containing protein n=1 Tax=Sutcliffiella halmapala TaxID=79882 RepID=UPI000994ED85|nr:helix-turn-helix transcriptional regulator [Sutcliffiella halmapala]
MKEGLIIKLYRERAGLTQTQLGEGICSVTHVSKIERGNTQYSSEITNLICQRLNIDLQKEKEQYDLLEKKLQEWLEVMVKQQMEDLEQIKKEIEDNTYVHISEVQHSYRILLGRYFILKGNLSKAKDILENCQSKWNLIDRYEKHLLDHTWGIYYFSLGKSKKAIDYLKNINPIEYNNHEFYYHLACASHQIQAKVKAYHYGNLALSYFRKTNNFKRTLDTETLMLLQIGYNDIFHFEETVQKYHSLIKTCHTFKEIAKETMLWHNLGVEYERKDCYEEAKHAFNNVLEKSKQTNYLKMELFALRGYIHCSLQLGNYSKTEMSALFAKGKALAKRQGNETFLHVFYLLEIMMDTGKNNDYFEFLKTTFLPHLREVGNLSLLSMYEKELFYHYRNTSQYQKANEIAARYLEYYG